MDKQVLSNALHVGGCLENALTGDYSLKAGQILQEGFQLTQKNFWRFLPAILTFALVNVFLFFFILNVISETPSEVIKAYIGRNQMSAELLSDGQVALFVSHILIAPLYAGASLMGLSHAIGFQTKPRHLMKGLSFSVAVMVVVMTIALLQTFGNQLFPLLGVLLSVTFSMAVLLICEKRMNPIQAMIVSFRAISKKLLTLLVVYAVIAVLFIFAYATAGIALVWALPFMFNVKGVLYREMFGVGIEVTVTKSDDDNNFSDHDSDNNKEVFNA